MIKSEHSEQVGRESDTNIPSSGRSTEPRPGPDGTPCRISGTGTSALPCRLFDVVMLLFAGALILIHLMPPGSLPGYPARASEQHDRKPLQQMLNEPVSPVPLPPLDIDPRKAALGERLFSDPRLSADDSISCASCHKLELGGADRMPRSLGVDGKLGEINAPTVYNSALLFRQFWDGRARDLSEQVAGPIHNPLEMASDWQQVVEKLSGDALLVDSFERIYADGVTPDNITDAIVSFERTLNTPDAPFDRFLRGEIDAITEAAGNGYRLFKSKGCIACHQGAAIGGNLYSYFGVMGDYFGDRGAVTPADYGRYNVTGLEEHRYMFKVPSLRNVALTAPYFHDASAATLEEAVRVMIRYQLGQTATEEEVADLVAFLESLTGSWQRRNTL